MCGTCTTDSANLQKAIDTVGALVTKLKQSETSLRRMLMRLGVMDSRTRPRSSCSD